MIKILQRNEKLKTAVLPAKSDFQYLISIPVIVADLGYFVDIYDLLLFGIVRLLSLRSMGMVEASLSSTGASILNWQITRLLLGGKKGRLSVLFGSILTYSIANIACGFVGDIITYKVIGTCLNNVYC